MKKLFDIVSIEDLEVTTGTVDMDVTDVVTMEDLESEIDYLRTELYSTESLISSTEETLVTLNESLELDMSFNNDIDKNVIELSLEQFNISALSLGYAKSFDISNESIDKDLNISMELKRGLITETRDKLKLLYDKFKNLMKKLMIKAILFMTDLEKKSDKLLMYLNEERSNSKHILKMDDNVEKQVINKCGALLFGFSDGSIDSKYINSAMVDITDSDSMKKYIELTSKLIGVSNLVINDLSSKLFANPNLSASGKTMKAIRDSFYSKTGSDDTKTFRYKGIRYKYLDFESNRDLPKSLTWNELRLEVAGIKTKIYTKEIDVSKIKGKFKEVKYDELIEITKKLKATSLKVKDFSKTIDNVIGDIVKNVDELINNSGHANKDTSSIIFPIKRFSNTMITTVSLEKVLGYIDFIKDNLSMVNILAKECIGKGSPVTITDPSKLLN